MRLIGRVDELAEIDSFLGELADPPVEAWVLLLLGMAGIGKTALGDAAREHAAARGLLVLSARPVEAESPLGFSALGDLFADVPDDALTALPAPQRRALQVALLREDVGTNPPDPRSVATAALGLLRELSSRQPVLLAIDDLGLVDAETARVLAFCARRLGDIPVGLIATARTDDAGNAPELLTDAVDVSHRRLLRPSALSIGAVGELLRERLDWASSRRELTALYDASAGNPLLALELARGAQHGEAGTIPESLRRTVHARIAALDPPVRELLLFAALLPDPEPALLDAAAGADTRAAREIAENAGILTIVDGRLRFTHPLLRSAAAGTASAPQRRDAHRRLADVLRDPGDIARHRALSSDTPDPAIAAALDAAAHRAHLRGAFETAAELGDLALRLTPPTDAALDRKITVAQYRFDANDPAGARELLGEVVARDDLDRPRAPLLVQLSIYERHGGVPLEQWEQTLTTALELAGDDVDLVLACHRDLGFAAANSARMDKASEHGAAIMQLLDRCTDPLLEAELAAGLAWILYAQGLGVPRELAHRGLNRITADQYRTAELSPHYSVAVLDTFSGNLLSARDLMTTLVQAVRDRGDETGLSIASWLLAKLLTLTGDLDVAEKLCADAVQAAAYSGSLGGAALVNAALTLLRAVQGDVEAAYAAAEQASTLGSQVGLQLPGAETLGALMMLELSRGDHEAAAGHARRYLDELTRDQTPHPLRVFVPNAAEALVRADARAAAEAAIAAFEALPPALFPVWSEVGARRVRALLAIAAGDVDAARDHAAAALAAAAQLVEPLERGRTGLIAAEVERRARQRRRAQELLEAARDCFTEAGASLWLQRCERDLERLQSGRTTDDSQLTVTERKVAELAARGHTSREIAAQLFTSQRTVESHLQRVYRKLGVRSRVEMTRQLDADT